MSAATVSPIDREAKGEDVAPLSRLRDPFLANQIGKLPKGVSRGDQDKGRCERGSKYSADGEYCGGWHARSVHLDYVGHAAITDRLLDVDPLWSWEPLAVGEDGLPKLDGYMGLWIRLTVCGVTRLGYGDADGKTGPSAIKEAIGDALRNAGMRFGLALTLWHKGDLHVEDTEPEPRPAQVPADPVKQLKRQIVTAGAKAGIAADQLPAHYASQTGGGVLTEASVDDLENYLAVLETSVPS